MFQENIIETCILSSVKHITGPGWMHETSARTWCSGRTWRERVGREVGGGIGMGNTCEPKAFSFQCITKFTTNKKFKKNNNNTATQYLRVPIDITRTSLVVQPVKNPPAMQETPVQFLDWKDLLKKGQATHFSILGSDSKESICNAGVLGSIPGLGRSPGGGHGNPLQYSCLENSHGQRSLAGYSSLSHRELDTTE